MAIRSRTKNATAIPDNRQLSRTSRDLHLHVGFEKERSLGDAVNHRLNVRPRSGGRTKIAPISG